MVSVLGLFVGACGDDSKPSRLDGGAPDSAVSMDVGLPDDAMPDAAPAQDATKDASKDVSIADTPAVDGSADSGNSAMVARDAYLVDHLIACSDCHTPRLPSGAPDMNKYLAGNAAFVQLPNGDVLPSRNLTPDKATGLGNYTAGQIKRMFLDGVAPGGPDAGTRALNPIMPYYYPERASALRGRYLAAESGLCIECHTPHNTTGSSVISPSKFFQGGEDFSAYFAGTLNLHPVSANLTSDPTTGLGNWTADQIVNVILSGKDKAGAGICPPMPVGPSGAYGGITSQDALDIANYIKSLPPVVHDVPDMCSWPPTPPPVDGGDAGPTSIDTGSG